MVTDSGQIVVREQWDHPYKEGSSLFRFHISVANIVQSAVHSHEAFARLWFVIHRLTFQCTSEWSII